MLELRIQKAVRYTHGDIRKLFKVFCVIEDCSVCGFLDDDEYLQVRDFFLDEVERSYGKEIFEIVFNLMCGGF